MVDNNAQEGTRLLDVQQHPSSSYAPRTHLNTAQADLTVAFAMDFETAGEKLTKRAAGERYVGIPMSLPPLDAARILFKHLRHHNAKVLNVAGNGIYTLNKSGWTQAAVDQYVFAVLQTVHAHWTLAKVRSGGQTGVDIAGVSAAFALGWLVSYLLKDKRRLAETTDPKF